MLHSKEIHKAPVETYFGPMGSQKSAILLNKAADYRRLNLPVLVMKPEIDTKTGSLVGSRTGQEVPPDFLIPPDIDQRSMADELRLWHLDAKMSSDRELKKLHNRLDKHELNKLRGRLGESALRSSGLQHIFVDEAQFGRPDVLDTIVWFSQVFDVPVDFYAIRSDFRNERFEGSTFLDQISDKVHELHGACRCGGKTVLNARKINGKFVFDGDQIAMDGQDDVTYESLCDDCYTLERQEVEPLYVHRPAKRPYRRQNKLTLVLGADESINSEVAHAITTSKEGGGKITSYTPNYSLTSSHEDMGSPQLIDAEIINDIEYFRKDRDVAFQQDIKTLLESSDVITTNSSLSTRLAHFAMRTVIGEPRFLQPSEIIDEVNKITIQWLANSHQTPKHVMYLHAPPDREQSAKDPHHPAYNSPFYRDVYAKVLGEAARSIALNTTASVEVYDTSRLSVDDIHQKYLSDSSTIWRANGGIFEVLPQY